MALTPSMQFPMGSWLDIPVSGGISTPAVIYAPQRPIINDTPPPNSIEARCRAIQRMDHGPKPIFEFGLEGIVNPHNLHLSHSAEPSHKAIVPANFGSVPNLGPGCLGSRKIHWSDVGEVLPTFGNGPLPGSTEEPQGSDGIPNAKSYERTRGACTRCRRKRLPCDKRASCTLCKVKRKACVYDEASRAGAPAIDKSERPNSKLPRPQPFIRVAIFKDSNEEEASAKRMKIGGGKGRTLEEVQDANNVDDFTDEEDWEDMGARALRRRDNPYRGLS